MAPMPMKTRSDRLAAAVLAAAALRALPADASAAAGEIFAQNREGILSTNAVVVGGFVFCVGRAASEDRFGASVGFGKARLLAWGQWDRRLFESAEWPEGATPQECRAAWSDLRGKSSDAEGPAGAEIVCETQPATNLWVAVIAVPESETSGCRPSAGDLSKAVADARSRLERESRIEPKSVPAEPADDVKAESVAEPRGLWEEGGVLANETMSDGQF